MCEIDDSIGSQYTHTLLILADLSAIEDSKISLGIAWFISCKYTVPTDNRFNDSYCVTHHSLRSVVCDTRCNGKSKIILWTDDSGECDRAGFIYI